MNGVARVLIAQHAVLGIRRHAPDDVAGIDVFQVDRDSLLLEVRRDPVLQEQPDVLVKHIARCVLLHRTGQQVLPRALRDDNQRVAAFQNALLERRKEPRLALQLERHFGDEREVDLLARQRRHRRDEARIAAHQADQADAVGVAVSLRVSAGQHVAGPIHGGDKTERTPDIHDVVVDRLRNAHDGDRKAAPANFLHDRVRAALRAVAAHAEKNVDPVLLQEIDHDRRRLLAAGGAEDRTALHVDVLHDLGGQCHRRQSGGFIQALVAVADAQHILDAVVVEQLVEHRPDHVVQARAKPAAGHQGHPRFRRIEEQVLAGTGPLEPQVTRIRLPVDHDIETNPLLVRDEIPDQVVADGVEGQGRRERARAQRGNGGVHRSAIKAPRGEPGKFSPHRSG